jgi:hypothetical protein
VSEDRYLIWSNQHRSWWRSNSYGYTRDIASAGYYSRAEAMHICLNALGSRTEAPDELPIRLVDAEEFAAALMKPPLPPPPEVK